MFVNPDPHTIRSGHHKIRSVSHYCLTSAYHHRPIRNRKKGSEQVKRRQNQKPANPTRQGKAQPSRTSAATATAAFSAAETLAPTPPPPPATAFSSSSSPPLHHRQAIRSRDRQDAMEDWDCEDFQPVAPAAKAEPLKKKWADEDVEEEDVKDSWEEEEEEKPKPQPVEKAASKPSGKGAAKKGKQQASTSTEVVEDEVLDDPIEEKLRQQRLVEEADFKSTAELFAKKDGSEKLLDTFIPKSDSDFAEYAELIANKLRPYEKSFHYMALLKNVMRLSMTSLKGADAKDISSSIAAIANEKIKAEKEAAAGKKKQGAKKKQLHIEKGDDDFIPGQGGAFDDPDDYDFM